MDKLKKLQVEYRSACFEEGQAKQFLTTVSRSERILKQTEIQIMGFLFILLAKNDGVKKLTRKERQITQKIFRRINPGNFIIGECKYAFANILCHYKMATMNRKSIECYREKFTREIGVIVAESGNFRRLYDSCKNIEMSAESVVAWLDFYQEILQQYRNSRPFADIARDIYKRKLYIRNEISDKILKEEERLRIIRDQERRKQEEEQRKSGKKKSKKFQKKPDSITVEQTKGQVF